MSAQASDNVPGGSGSARFATTHWSIVVKAGHRSSPDSDQALESLCQTYWYPLYAYVRRRGRSAEDARDLTQEFFARLLEKEFLRDADRQRGRFRAFLLTVFKRFLATEYARQQAQKRGGGRQHLSLDFDGGEQRYRLEPADEWTAEKIYERRWALILLDRVLAQLQEDYRGRGQEELFLHCRSYLTAAAGGGYAEAAAALDMSEGAVRVAVHRLRQRYRDLLKAEVAQTVAQAEDVEDELETLRAALRGQKK